jgi:hypothetical protein
MNFFELVMHFFGHVGSVELEMVLVHATNNSLIDGIQSLALVLCSLLTALY